MPNVDEQIMKPLVSILDGQDACWLWTGSVSHRTGYGKKQLGGKTISAHRWMYSIFKGHIPDGMTLDHTCKNRQCVNPNHLEIVSQAENCRRSTATKLTRQQVIEIKARLATLKWGQRAALAKEFGVTPALISDIKFGRAWVDV